MEASQPVTENQDWGPGGTRGPLIRGRFPVDGRSLGRVGHWLTECGLEFRGLGAGETSQELFSDWSVGIKNSTDHLEAKNGN